MRVKSEAKMPTLRQSFLSEYSSWSAMRARCNTPDSQMWRYYGARGITICERWNSFAAFLEDMGPRPSPKHSLDRINNDGNYEPGNCRWATIWEQNNNRRPRNSTPRPPPREPVAQLAVGQRWKFKATGQVVQIKELTHAHVVGRVHKMPPFKVSRREWRARLEPTFEVEARPVAPDVKLVRERRRQLLGSTSAMFA